VGEHFRVMVTLVNYGVGNIHAFLNIYKSLNIAVDIASDPSQLSSAKKIILPGVGSFDWAMSRLNASRLREPLDDLVLRKNIPVLGICVGMQIMAKSSHEGQLPGLGWIDAEVRAFEGIVSRRDLRYPHMGWNEVAVEKNNPLFVNLENPQFYFLHSFCFIPGNPSQMIGSTYYGEKFTSAVSENHIYGVQFHPEKSHNCGIQLLKNFSEL